MSKDPFDGYGDTNVFRLPLRASRVRLPNPATIPPRAWLYGTLLMRGFVSLLVSPGGVGKTQLGIVMSVAVASGRNLLGHPVHHRANAWNINLEDPLDELERRLAAVLIFHGIDNAEVGETLFMDSGRDRKLCMAMLDPDGNSIVYPDKAEIIAVARACNIGLIVVDPFIKSHSLEENSNPHMDAAATAWAEVATEANCAVLIIHHVRKGPVVDVDAARGGSALKDAARMTMMLSAMTAEEGEKLGISEVDRWRHVRLDDGKANMAARTDHAEWFVMHPIELGNGTSDYPFGDTVTALGPWTPPSVAGSATMGQVIETLEAIIVGPQQGELFTADNRGRINERWVGNLIMKKLDMKKGQAVALLDAWLNSGLLLVTEYHSDVTRKMRPGVRVNMVDFIEMKAGNRSVFNGLEL